VSGWLILGGYVCIALLTWRFFAIRHVETCAQDTLAELNRRFSSPTYRSQDRERWIAAEIERSGGLVPGYERGYGAGMGALAGVFWPLFWVGVGALLLLDVTTNGLSSPTEVAAEQRAKELAELEALRKLAREHNLPMPEEHP
jgi:hypothetical protein